MNDDVIKTFHERAKIIQNLDKIISSGRKSKSNFGQFSLFGEGEGEGVSVDITLDEPREFNPIEYAAREKEVLGFNMTYSPFEEYEILRCRYCNATIYSILQEEVEFGNKTILAEVRDIEYKTSQYGNPYAKIIFGDESGEERLYLSGKLYKKNISNTFVGRIYLLTVEVKPDRTITIVDYAIASGIDMLDCAKRMYVKCNVDMMPKLRMYTRVFMSGTKQGVIVKIDDMDRIVSPTEMVNVDNKNLVEMRKLGFEIKLR